MTTKLEQAAQQALEALETCETGSWSMTYDEPSVAEAITALRDALEQLNCQCGDKCFPVFSGNREYCETCGWPIVSGEDHNPNKVDEKALLEALAKQARHLNVEPVKLFTSDDIKVAFENGYAAAMSVADVAKETEQEPTVSNGVCGGCAKKAADGWALYCVECWEKSNGDPFANLGKSTDEQAEQEPVAEVVLRNQTVGFGRTEKRKDIVFLADVEVGTKLYAAPVRTKDLTDDEIMKINVDTAGIVPTCDRQFHFARAVIAADRDKNK